jgi:hypothetical protein
MTIRLDELVEIGIKLIQLIVGNEPVRTAKEVTYSLQSCGADDGGMFRGIADIDVNDKYLIELKTSGEKDEHPPICHQQQVLAYAGLRQMQGKQPIEKVFIINVESATAHEVKVPDKFKTHVAYFEHMMTIASMHKRFCSKKKKKKKRTIKQKMVQKKKIQKCSFSSATAHSM